MPEAPSEECSVCVAVKIRPLVQSEIDVGSASTLLVTPGLPQVASGTHSFTYDHVYGDPPAEAAGQLYEHCVSPLVEGLFRGYNATVLAYGQTGSGKTFTMGSEYKPGGRTDGVIPDVISNIFARVAAVRATMDVTVRVSFIEIHNEKIRDLLLPAGGQQQRPISIREIRGKGGGVFVEGAVERVVRNADETASALEMGSLCRSTAATNMNTRSSRSHAIFTLTVEQRRNHNQAAAASPALSSGVGEDEDEEAGGAGGGVGEDDDGGGDDFLVAKMHLVDLAGSERAKRTKAQGVRMKEGICINESLFALGNVINAIVENRFVPYRDSKLTRLLQDSLGGNSRTVMIACVSPADINYDETVNTLRYAQHARSIKNKPVVNRDPLAAQVAALRAQLAASRAEVVALKRLLGQAGRSPEDVTAAVLDAASAGGGRAGGAAAADGSSGGDSSWVLVQQLEAMRLAMAELELQHAQSQVEMRDVREELDEAMRRWQVSQAQLVALRSACTRGVQDWSEGDRTSLLVKAQEGGEMETVRGYLSRITELEREVKSLRAFQRLTSSVPQRHHRGSTSSRAGTSPGQATTDPSGAAMSCLLTGASVDGSSPQPSPSAQSDHNSPAGLVGRLHGDADDGGGAGVGRQEYVEEDDDEGREALDDFAEMDEEQRRWILADRARTLEDQERMRAQMAALQQLADQKQKQIDQISGAAQPPALKQHYDRVLADVQTERDNLQAERKALLTKLHELASRTEEEQRRLEQQYRERLKAADERLSLLKTRERDYAAMQLLKQRTDKVCERLNAEIVKIKQQKVAVQKQLEASQKQSALTKTEGAREVLHLRRDVRLKSAEIQNLVALQAKQNAVLQRKIADANAARKKVRDMEAAAKLASQQRASSNGGDTAQQRAAGSSTGGTGGTAGGTGVTDTQPSATAPLLRTEKTRRQWIERELDMCNMSFEYKRILDGELAQRAEATQQLKTVEKKLMMVSHLTPASPLTAQDGLQAATPLSRAAGHAYKLEPQEQLLARRTALEHELLERNSAIVELQQTIERAKADEEARGGGAADARRWTGVRSVAESRELLKTLFRTAADHKALANDSQVDITQLQEKIDVLRVQLDGARKEAERLRYRAAQYQAAAATAAAASPFVESSVLQAAGGETDVEVDQLVQELQVLHASGSTPNGHASPPGASKCNGAAASAPTDAAGCSPEEGAGRTLQFDCGTHGGSPTTPLLSGGKVRSLGSPGGPAPPFGAASSKRVERYSPAEDDDDVVVVDSDDDDGGSHDGGDGAADEESASSDEEDDDEWDPSKATPARPWQGPRKVGATRAASHRTSTGAHAPPAAGSSVPPADPSDSRRGSGASSSNGDGGGGGGLGAGGKSVTAEMEAAALEAVNAARAAQGLPKEARFIKKTIEEQLKGKMVGGKVWKAGSKTRDQMLRDLCEYLGLLGPPSHLQQQEAAAATSSSHQRSSPTEPGAPRVAAWDVSPPLPSGGTSPSGVGGTGPGGAPPPGSVSPAGSRQHPTTSGGGAMVLNSPTSNGSPRHAGARVWRTPGPSPCRSSMPANFLNASTTTATTRSPAQSPSGANLSNNPRDYRTGSASAVHEGGSGSSARRSSSGSGADNSHGSGSAHLRGSVGSLGLAMGREVRAHSNFVVPPGLASHPAPHQLFGGGSTGRQDSVPWPEAASSPVGSPRHGGGPVGSSGGGGMVAAMRSHYEASVASRRALAESSPHLHSHLGSSPSGRGSGGTTPRTGGLSHFATHGQYNGQYSSGTMTPMTDASLSDVRDLLGPGPQRDKVATPMSMYYQQKTQAARLRTLQMQDLSNDQEAGGVVLLGRSNPLRMSQPCLSGKDNDALAGARANAFRESMRPSNKTIWK